MRVDGSRALSWQQQQQQQGGYLTTNAQHRPSGQPASEQRQGCSHHAGCGEGTAQQQGFAELQQGFGHRTGWGTGGAHHQRFGAEQRQRSDAAGGMGDAQQQRSCSGPAHKAPAATRRFSEPGVRQPSAGSSQQRSRSKQRSGAAVRPAAAKLREWNSSATVEVRSCSLNKQKCHAWSPGSSGVLIGSNVERHWACAASTGSSMGFIFRNQGEGVHRAGPLQLSFCCSLWRQGKTQVATLFIVWHSVGPWWPCQKHAACSAWCDHRHNRTVLLCCLQSPGFGCQSLYDSNLQWRLTCRCYQLLPLCLCSFAAQFAAQLPELSS